MEANPEDVRAARRAHDDYVLYLGGLILEAETLKAQCAHRCDLQGVLSYGTLVRDLSRYRDALTATHCKEMAIPPNVAALLRRKLNNQ